jgi:hypothetical protein
MFVIGNSYSHLLHPPRRFQDLHRQTRWTATHGRGGIAGVVVTELSERPGAKDDAQAGLGQDGLSVRVLAKMASTCPSRALTCL